MDITKKASPIPLNNLRRSSDASKLKYVPKPYREVASGMEGQFAKFMLEQMRKSVDSSDNSQAAKMYKDLLLDERAKLMSKNNGGLGLQEVILDQLYPKRFRNKLNYNAYLNEAANRSKLAQRARNQRADAEDIKMDNTASLKENSNE